MCGLFGGGGGDTPAPIYQAPVTPAPVTAKAVELKEEDDLVTNDNDSKKKSGKDALRIDKSDPLGLGTGSTGGTAKKTGLNLFS